MELALKRNVRNTGEGWKDSDIVSEYKRKVK